MDGENNGSKPYEQMDDLGWKKKNYFWFNTHMVLNSIKHEKWPPNPRWDLVPRALLRSSYDRYQGLGIHSP